MKVIVAATDKQWEELNTGRSLSGWEQVDNMLHFGLRQDADAFINLRDDQALGGKLSFNGKPVIIHSVVQTLEDLDANKNILRINGWPGFLKRPSWEIAGQVDDHVRAIFNACNIRLNQVADEPGFISGRILAMIINEAYLALQDEVSSKKEIDTAMKLGTNYPFGPFEWGAAIGMENILALLEKLSKKSDRYKPAEILQREVKQKTA